MMIIMNINHGCKAGVPHFFLTQMIMMIMMIIKMIMMMLMILINHSCSEGAPNFVISNNHDYTYNQNHLDDDDHHEHQSWL